LVRDVVVVFGSGAAGNELWFGIKLACRKKGHVRLQYLAAMEGAHGMFTATAATDVFADNMVEHTFKRTIFVETKTSVPVQRGRSKKRKVAPTVKVQTKNVLDTAILENLQKQCEDKPALGKEGDDEDGADASSAVVEEEAMEVGEEEENDEDGAWEEDAEEEAQDEEDEEDEEDEDGESDE
jgi:hypothetical protein